MKILHINTLSSGTGSAVAMMRLHELFLSKGIESKVHVLKKDIIDNNVSETSWVNRNVISRFFRWKENRFLKKGLLGFSGMSGCVSIDEIPMIKSYDAVFIHWTNNGFLDFYSLKDSKLNIIIIMHDMWHFTGGCHICKDIYLEDKTNKCSHNLQLEKVTKLIDKKNDVYESCSIKFISPSKIHLDYAAKSMLLENRFLKHIPHYLDSKKYCSNNTYQRKKSKKTILFGAMGGKDNPYKGFIDMVKAVNRVALHRDDFEVTIFGNSNLILSEEFTPKVPIKIVGILDEEKLINLFNKSDIFVFPSLYESFGQILLEAMACGVCPVSYPVGIAPEIINESNGYLCKSNSIDELIKGLDYVLDESEKLSRHASIAAQNYCDGDKIFNDFIEVINEE